MNTDELVSSLEVLAAKATPGPVTITGLATKLLEHCYAMRDADGWAIAVNLKQSDATFYAACREGVPQICAEVGRLREALFILRTHQPIHNDFESYLFDVATWGLGESDNKPEWKEPNDA